VGVPAPEALVDDLAAVFLATGGDMTAVLSALARHPLFLDAAAPQRVAHPLDYVVRLSRVCGRHDPWRASAYLQTSGQGLFDHPTPDGYPEEDAVYVGTYPIVQRWRVAVDTTEALAGLVPHAWSAEGGELQDEAWAQAVIDLIAVRITGRVLSEASNRAALDILAAAEGSRHDRVRVIAPFIALLPEANLR
jgi:uncharacterized protein (DUF1800 family)